MVKLDIKPGTYVVAVSGGVDSMVLLDLLTKLPKLKLIVAHYDHGMRSDSEQDRQLVQKTAERHGLPFVYDYGHLGVGTSEAVARTARYKFLQKVKKAAGASAIITAHHQDDVLETAIINLLRGTNRHGLSSLQNQPDILRPLLRISKADLLKYAHDNKITWREDSTNADEAYLRNYVRLSLVPKLTTAKKTELLAHIDKLGELNKDIDNLINSQLKNQTEIDRQWFIMLGHNVARDVMATWLKNHGAREVDKKQLELLVQAAKTYSPNRQTDIDKQYTMLVSKDKLALIDRER